MIAIARGITTFDSRSSFSTWAYRIATNTSLDELRRRRRRLPAESSDALGELALGAGSSPAGSQPIAAGSPEDAVGEAATARVILDQALEQVSEEHRTAVVLRDMLDLDYAEIAEVLRVPIGTVRSRIARGRAALAQALECDAEARPIAVHSPVDQPAGDGLGNPPGVPSVQVDKS
jgi:RNA polymerase sigma-70 factor (ECF subfamily)